MIAEVAQQKSFDSVASLSLGQIRTFGELGPHYEIKGFPDEGLVEIEVIPSGEVSSYSARKALQDPIAE